MVPSRSIASATVSSTRSPCAVSKHTGSQGRTLKAYLMPDRPSMNLDAPLSMRVNTLGRLPFPPWSSGPVVNRACALSASAALLSNSWMQIRSSPVASSSTCSSFLPSVLPSSPWLPVLESSKLRFCWMSLLCSLMRLPGCSGACSGGSCSVRVSCDSSSSLVRQSTWSSVSHEM